MGCSRRNQKNGKDTSRKNQQQECRSYATRNEKSSNLQTPIKTTILNGQRINGRRFNLASLDRLPNHYDIEQIVKFGPSVQESLAAIVRKEELSIVPTNFAQSSEGPVVLYQKNLAMKVIIKGKEVVISSTRWHKGLRTTMS
mgnify:FL=1